MIALGVVMGFTPDQVRSMTLLDFFTALNGHNQANKPREEQSQAPTLEQHREMKARIRGNHGTNKPRT